MGSTGWLENKSPPSPLMGPAYLPFCDMGGGQVPPPCGTDRSWSVWNQVIQ